EYSSLYIFKYSPRPGTKADRNFADDVPNAVKIRRNHELLAIQSEIGRQLRSAWIGRSVDVLVEGRSKLARRDATHVQESEQDRGCEVAPRGEVLSPGNATHGNTAARRDGSASTQLVGRSPQDMIVVFDSEESLSGAVVSVRVDAATPHTLQGR